MAGRITGHLTLHASFSAATCSSSSLLHKLGLQLTDHKGIEAPLPLHMSIAHLHIYGLTLASLLCSYGCRRRSFKEVDYWRLREDVESYWSQFKRGLLEAWGWEEDRASRVRSSTGDTGRKSRQGGGGGVLLPWQDDTGDLNSGGQ